jgi:hypothetical protein
MGVLDYIESKFVIEDKYENAEDLDITEEQAERIP